MSLMPEALGNGLPFRFPVFSLLCRNDLKPWAMLVGTCGTVCLPIFTDSDTLESFLEVTGQCDPDIVEFDTTAELVNFLCYQQREIHAELVVIDPSGLPTDSALRLPVEDFLLCLGGAVPAVQP